MSKIFVRERKKADKGDKKPRFRVVGATGDIKLYAPRIRKIELEIIEKETGAQVIYLPQHKSGNKDGKR